MLRETREAHEFLTGLVHIDEGAESFLDRLRLVQEPLATLPEEVIKPGPEVLEEHITELM